MKAFVVIALLTVFSVVIAREKPKIVFSKIKTGVLYEADSLGVEKTKPYIKLTLEEIDRELSNIEALREQYIATLNMLEGQKQLFLKMRADTTRVVKWQTRKK